MPSVRHFFQTRIGSSLGKKIHVSELLGRSAFTETNSFVGLKSKTRYSGSVSPPNISLRSSKAFLVRSSEVNPPVSSWIKTISPRGVERVGIKLPESARSCRRVKDDESTAIDANISGPRKAYDRIISLVSGPGHRTAVVEYQPEEISSDGVAIPSSHLCIM